MPLATLFWPSEYDELCQAGVNLTVPPVKAIVPPWLPLTTSRTPCDSSQLPSSTVQITLASFHSAMSTVSPTWSLWAWVSRIVLGLSDFGSTEVTGLSSMNGSMATTVPASSSSRYAECPIQVSFGIDSLRGYGSFAAGSPHAVSMVRGDWSWVMGHGELGSASQVVRDLARLDQRRKFGE